MTKKGCFVMKNSKQRNDQCMVSARAVITMKPETLNGFILGEERELKEMRFSAEDAGYMAAKRTQEAIPMCFPLPLEAFQFEFLKQDEDRMEIRCNIHTKEERTSAGMEALSAASTAAFLLKDMCHHRDSCMNVSDVAIL